MSGEKAIRAAARTEEKYRFFGGYSVTELFDEIIRLGAEIHDVLLQLKETEEIAASWMRDYDRLKNKYEPMILVTSGPPDETI